MRLSRDQLVGVDEHSRRLWHRTPPPLVPNWPGIHLDLTGAALADFSLQQCQLYHADLRNAEFLGRANFVDAQFTLGAHFGNGHFTDRVYFWNARFSGDIYFGGAQFLGKADFEGAQFTVEPNLEGAQVTAASEAQSVWPPGWTTRLAKPENDEDPAFRYLTKVQTANSLSA